MMAKSGGFVVGARVGEVPVNGSGSVVVQAVTVGGEARVDVRKFKASATYSGPTSQGLSLTVDQWREVVELLAGVLR